MTIYGVDVASYQGAVDWSAVYKTGIRFGFSKVTENVGYVNPYWAHNRKGMLALGSGFLPGAYHFLHGGNGADQAKHFLDAAGGVSDFAVALDVEASGADAATAKAWVTEFKKRTGGHPVIGYFPAWYWSAHGRPDLSFFDTIWQSRYVSGAGSPSGLYGKVPASWWATFGGEPISILQFSSSATVAGVSGHVDVNAYRGTLDQLRALALGIKEDDMAISDEDALKIAKLVWSGKGMDVLTAPGLQAGETFPAGPDKTNPTWYPASFPRQTIQGLWWLGAKIDAYAKQAGADVDEEALARAILTSLTPEAIAAAVEAALPADLAKQVADELSSRLAS